MDFRKTRVFGDGGGGGDGSGDASAPQLGELLKMQQIIEALKSEREELEQRLKATQQSLAEEARTSAEVFAVEQQELKRFASENSRLRAEIDTT